MKKKGKPPNISRYEAEKLIKQAKKEATDEATSMCLTLMFSVLLDKFNGEDYIKDVYDAWNERAVDVIEGRVKLHEWRNVLRKEYFIDI